MSTDDGDDHASKWLWGSTIGDDGEIRFLSVSSISKGTPEEGGCLRKWWFHYHEGHKPPDTKSQTRGRKGHRQVFEYLSTGVNALGPLAMRGFHMIPRPAVRDAAGRSDLMLEFDLGMVDPNVEDEIRLIRDLLKHPPVHTPIAEAERARAEARRAALVQHVLDSAPLRADDIPILGQLDLCHARGENKGTDNIEQAWDPPGTREVCDWKFVTDERFLKAPGDLPKLVQMSGYGAWVYRVFPNTGLTRLSHGYFVEKGRSQKRTIRVDRDVIERNWARAESTTRALRHVARCKTAAEVEPNLSACSAYGGCPHRKECPAGSHNSLAAIIGQTAAAEVFGRAGVESEPLVQIRPRTEPQPHAFSTTPAGESHMMSLMDQIKQRAAQTAAAPAQPANGAIQTAPSLVPPQTPAPVVVQAPPVIVQPAPVAQPSVAVAMTISPEVAKLQAEEAAARAAYGQPSVSHVAQVGTPAPMLAQTMAPVTQAAWPPGFPEAIAQIDAAGRGFPHSAGNAARAIAALRNYPPAQGYAGSGEMGAAGVTITEPHQVFQLVEELKALGAPQTTPAPQPVVQSALPPDAPVSAPPAAVPQGNAIAATTALADAKPKRTRKKTAAQGTAGSTETAQSEEGLAVYVDCFVSTETADFGQLVTYMTGELLKEFPCMPADIRCAPKDSPLAFGGWRGALHAFTKEIFAKGMAPLVPMRVDSSNELAAACVAALAEICAEQGAPFVRGSLRGGIGS